MRKELILCCTLSIMLIFSNLHAQTPPYSGTIFIDPDIITESDPSTLVSTSYAGRGERTVYDRRVEDWVTVNAFLFDVVWNDGLTSEAVINPEFGSVAAATVEAEKYAYVVGQLPHCLRVDIDQIWVHQGEQLFGGANHAVLIHTGQTLLYEADGILEETLIHEASHTSLDKAHSESAGWVAAQEGDAAYISAYALENPVREDVAESFLLWLALRHRTYRISEADFDTIGQTIPKRLTYFDEQNFDLYPVTER
jgi:hypothetical protein